MKSALLLAFFVLLAAPARAQICTVSATGLSFGAYDPFAPSLAAITGSLTVTCRATGAVTVAYALQLGAGTGGNLAQRSLANGPARLNYQLYTDAARTAVWGDGTAGTGTVADGYALGALATISRTYTAYGAIPAGQTVTPGLYADLVTILVVY